LASVSLSRFVRPTSINISAFAADTAYRVAARTVLLSACYRGSRSDPTSCWGSHLQSVRPAASGFNVGRSPEDTRTAESLDLVGSPGLVFPGTARLHDGGDEGAARLAGAVDGRVRL